MGVGVNGALGQIVQSAVVEEPKGDLESVTILLPNLVVTIAP